jgi:hypothetical protein
MMPFSPNGECPDGSGQVLWEDGERVFCRGWRLGDDWQPERPGWSFCPPRNAHRPQASIASLTNTD